jgi:hypothetical protein
MRKLNPQVVWKAGGAIADSEIESDGLLASTDPTVGLRGPKVVCSPTRIDLFDGRYVLLLRDDELVLFLAPEDIDSFPYYALLYYLCYHSRVNYNIIHPPLGVQFPENLEPAEAIIFSMRKRVLVEREDTIFGQTGKFQHYESEPFSIRMSKSDIERHLKRATNELHLAISYFLIGCENLRYFLVEFYKAIEIIKLSFGSEIKLLKALKPHGLNSNDYKALKRYANDQHQPLDIGRHAPVPGTRLRHIDIRRLLTEPLSKDVWTNSVRITRLVIDTYSAYLFDPKR